MENDLDFLGLVKFSTIRRLCCGHVPSALWLWLAALQVMTFLNLMDQMTNALITAQLIGTSHCTAYEKISSVWTQTMGQSLIHKFTHLFISQSWFYSDFNRDVAFCYILQLVVQPLYVLYTSLPLRPDTRWRPDSLNSFSAEKAFSQDNTEKYFVYASTKTIANCTYYISMINLAEANRMEAIVSQDYKVRVIRQRDIFNASTSDVQGFGKQLMQLLQLAHAAFSRSIQRFVMKGFFQNAIQINLQVSMLCLTKGVFGLEFLDGFQCFSVGLGVVGMLMDIPDMIQAVRFMNAVDTDIQKRMSEADRAGTWTTGQQEITRGEAEKAYNSFWWRNIRFRGWMCLYMFTALYAGVKLAMGIWVCDKGMWNMTIWDGHFGCVEYTAPSIA